MIQREPGTVNGAGCLWLRNSQLRLAVTTGLGPRILHCSWHGGANLFAELGDRTIGPPARPLRLLGGHRLWHAPEALERTYWPDDRPVAVSVDGATTSFVAPPDGAGIGKQLTITLALDAPRVTVRHTLRNEGLWPVELAPWAITACRLGGVAILPLPAAARNPDGLRPNRQVSLWPYSDLTDARLALGNRLILLRAEPGAANKIGTWSDAGWLAYWLEGTLFVKRYAADRAARYPDSGCNLECYVKDTYIELETLGPLGILAPGATTDYDETWELIPSPARPTTEAAALESAARAGLIPPP